MNPIIFRTLSENFLFETNQREHFISLIKLKLLIAYESTKAKSVHVSVYSLRVTALFLVQGC